MTKLFISYRRKDSLDVCGRISDRLELEFGKDNLFKDVESLLPGVDFHTQLSEAVGGCDICLVIIGPTWIDALDSKGNRRLLQDDDYVRIEIRTALLRGIPVIPLRVNGAALPCIEQLPTDIAPLIGKHSVEVQRDPDFHRSMDRIIADIHRLERSLQTKVQKNVPDVAIKQGDEIALLEELWTRAASPRSGGPRFLEGNTVGIDLGTTYSAIAKLSLTGDAEILPNTDGQRSTPSVVLLGDDGHIEIGPSFERSAMESPDHIVEAVKRQMGNRSFYVIYQNAKLTAEFISALILKKLKQDAESAIGPIANAVITVPYYFNDLRRKATQDAGRIAGLNVVDVINEPTAATLAYAWMRGELGRVDLSQDARTILVYDLGGGTFDVTVVRYTPTQFRVLATDGDVMLGGIDWTRRITDHIAAQFVHRFGADPRDDSDAMRDITLESENAKRALSTKSQVPLTIYFRGKTLSLNYSRPDFERITSDLMQRTRDTTELVLQQAGINPEDLSAVVMVGGSTYMPAVAQMLTEVCGRAPSLELNPEEAVAQGAAIYAAILEARETRVLDRLDEMVTRRLRSVTTNDVNSHSLGVKLTHSGERLKKFNHVMIPKNSPIPASTTQRFVTNAANQTSIHVYILEGESFDPDACTLIGDFRIDGLPPGLPAGSPVEVTYRYDSNGRIHATAKDLTNNLVATSEIVRDSGLTPNAVFDLEKLAREFIVE